MRIGIKDLSQMITNKTLFIIIVAAYFISDFFFNEAMLYIMGGGILGSLRELSDKKIAMLPSILIWVGLLAAFMALFYRLQSKPLKIFILLLIAALLYVVDFIRMELLPINSHDASLMENGTGRADFYK